MSLTNNGAGTVTIGVLGGTGSVSGSGLISSSQQITNFGFISSSLAMRKADSAVFGIQSITLTGSIFLDSSGSNGAFLRVDPFDASTILTGVITSSQQIVAFDVFAVKNSANSFVGTQTVTGSITATGTITAGDLYVTNSSNLFIPQGSVMVGGSGSRSEFLPTSSLTAASTIDVIDNLNNTFSNISAVKFTGGLTVDSSGSGVVVISSGTSGFSGTSGINGTSGTSGVSGVGSGFPFSGSAVISGSLEVTGSVTASAFVITSVGTPTIESATNINLTAGNAVLITTSSLRLASFSDAQTSSLTAVNGDMIYNSTTHKFMGYASGSWVQLH
jgi:hypothetical protein